MKFAVNENTIFQCDLVDFLKSSRKAGFSAVELSYSKLKDALKFVSAQEIKRQCADLEVLSLNAFEDVFFVPEENLKALEVEASLMGELCRAIECPVVVVPSGRWYSKYGALPEYKDLISISQNRLGLVKEILDQFEVETMFEPINYPEFHIGRPSEVNDLLDKEMLRDLRIVPDVHNLHYNGLGPSQLLEVNADIGIFHIDDTPGIPHEKLHVATTRVFPGDGLARVSDWVQTAYEKGYQGYFSLELFDAEIYKQTPDFALSLCRRKLDAFAESL
jgi:2-keto-myo-inositol isomerase